MGLGTVAASLVVLIALVSAGTVLAGTVADQATHAVEAQDQLIHRLRQEASENLTLSSAKYKTGPDRLDTTWTNDGGEMMRLDEVTLLANGVVTAHADALLFRVEGHPTSNLWGPGEVLDVTLVGYGNPSVVLVGPHGHAAYRRA